jgi:hypothetical protein
LYYQVDGYDQVVLIETLSTFVLLVVSRIGCGLRLAFAALLVIFAGTVSVARFAVAVAIAVASAGTWFRELLPVKWLELSACFDRACLKSIERVSFKSKNINTAPMRTKIDCRLPQGISRR